MFDKVTKSVRVLSAAAVEKANSGHPGMPKYQMKNLIGSTEIGLY